MRSSKSIERQLRRYYRRTTRKLRLPTITETADSGEAVVLVPPRKSPFLTAAAFAIYFIGILSMILLIWNANANRNSIIEPGSNPAGWAVGGTSDDTDSTPDTSRTDVPVTTENPTSTSETGEPTTFAPSVAVPDTTTPAVPETTPATIPATTPDTTPMLPPQTTPETTPEPPPVTTPATTPVSTPATTSATTPVTTPAATLETVNLMPSFFCKVEEDYSSMFGYTWDGIPGGAGETPDKLFDCDPETKLAGEAPDAIHQPIVWSMTKAVVVTRYSVTTGIDNKDWPGRNPLGWSLYGTNELSSNDPADGSWTLLHSVKDADLPDENFYTTYYEIDNTQAYRYYLLIFDDLTLYDGTYMVPVLTPDGDYIYDENGDIVREEKERPKTMQLSEFTLYGYAEES
ncbi:MAG: hypothetical protein ACI3YK_06970 [Eubacteriales bacterium]